MGYSMPLRNKMKYKDRIMDKQKKKIVIDDKEYNLSEFDDTHSWSKPKKKGRK